MKEVQEKFKKVGKKDKEKTKEDGVISTELQFVLMIVAFLCIAVGGVLIAGIWRANNFSGKIKSFGKKNEKAKKR
jgi:hypothetical protein